MRVFFGAILIALMAPALAVGQGCQGMECDIKLMCEGPEGLADLERAARLEAWSSWVAPRLKSERGLVFYKALMGTPEGERCEHMVTRLEQEALPEFCDALCDVVEGEEANVEDLGRVIGLGEPPGLDVGLELEGEDQPPRIVRSEEIQRLRKPRGDQGIQEDPPGRVTRLPRFEPPAEVRGLDKKIVARVVKHHLSKIRRCHEEALIKQPGVAGRIEVHWRIDVSGAVTSSRVMSNGTGSEALGACVAGVALEMRFPCGQCERAVEVKYPFNFSVD